MCQITILRLSYIWTVFIMNKIVEIVFEVGKNSVDQ